MSPTRRDILKASAGLVGIALASVPATAPTTEAQNVAEPPIAVGLMLASIGLRMSDGSTKLLTLFHERQDGKEGHGTFADLHPANENYEEALSAEDAEWAAMWITGAGYAVLKTLNDKGNIHAW